MFVNEMISIVKTVLLICLAARKGIWPEICWHPARDPARDVDIWLEICFSHIGSELYLKMATIITSSQTERSTGKEVRIIA